MQVTKSLFLRQSYLDSWSDYQKSLTSQRFITWDYIVLTASNEDQADAYRAQISSRRGKGLLPRSTHFAVIPDPDGMRVGSGGATLNVLKYIAEIESTPLAGEPPRTVGEDLNWFSGKRILVIHSGGDSKRVPQYSACGKLFSPVPRELPNGKRSSLFDEFIIGMSGVPSRIKEGMLVLSGDVLLLFNPLQIDYSGEGAAAISFKEHVETGKEHGVYTIDGKGNVGDFLHKLPVGKLRELGAVNDRELVDIDTGAVLLSCDLLGSLFSLISTNGRNDKIKFGQFVNDLARLSFYGDFLYPLASRSTREQYMLEKPEGGFCEELTTCREALWDTLNGYRMKLLRLAPAEFIHFGTTGELLKLVTQSINEYSFLNWSAQVSTNVSGVDYAVNNAVIDKGCEIGAGCYLEDSYITEGAKIGAGSVLSSVTVRGETVPEGIVLHGLKQKDGRFVVRVFGVSDNPKGTLSKDTPFLGTTQRRFMQMNGIEADELWPDGGDYVWFAKMYPVCDTIEAAMRAALNICAMARGEGDVEAWRACERKSLYEGFNEADTQAILDWEVRLRKLVKLEKLLQCIQSGGTLEQAKMIFAGSSINEWQQKWLVQRAEESDFSLKLRIYFYLGRILGDTEGESYMDRSLAVIRDGILEGALEGLQYDAGCRIARDEVTVNLPLRVNWGGGWSDTPPYCNEMGGTVLNAAISLNGRLPVEVCVRRLNEKRVIFESADVGSYGEFTTIEPLQKCSDPYDPFALHKAALITCGVIPMQGDRLDHVLDRIGGGIYLSTQVHNVPKGSGLGTSSILAGACVKGVFQFIGSYFDDNEIYNRALCMEQLMSTGGGWQDQVGGVTLGIKFIASKPGLRQQILVQQVNVPEQAMRELNDRFVLIYTGQRRLARNLLRDVIGHYITSDPAALRVLNEIQQVAALMRFELERGNVDAFAFLVRHHWELSKRLDSGSTNTCIDQIFLSVDDLIDGEMICGAGGGGFVQVLLRRGISRQQVSARLVNIFGDCGVSVWDSKLIASAR